MNSKEFMNLYESNYLPLMNFAKKLTRDITDAQDLVQETWLKAYKGLHTFKMGSSFKSWTFTILKNIYINQYNKRRRRNTISQPVESFVDYFDGKNSTNNSGIENMSYNEKLSFVNRLTVKSKVPFMMHYSGYSYEEIAGHLDIPIGTVKSRINFARTKLKEAIGNSSMNPV